LNRKCQLTGECQPVGIKSTVLAAVFGGALVSDQTVTRGSSAAIFIPKRSAASAEALNRKVTGRPSFFHAMSPPSRTQTFEMPFFRRATATRALVNSPDEEQYRTNPRFSGTTTRKRLRRRAGSIRTAPGMPARSPCPSSKSNRSMMAIGSPAVIFSFRSKGVTQTS
jgi:hypothetical protein